MYKTHMQSSPLLPIFIVYLDYIANTLDSSQQANFAVW